VGDDQRGAAPGGCVELGLDGFFGPGVERRGGFVENQDGRVLEQGAGDGDALLFAAGELEAALADRVSYFRAAGDEVFQLGGAGGGFDFLAAGFGAAVLDVVEQVSLNSTVSCGTMPIAARRLSWVRLRMSWPLMRTAPPVHVVEAIQQAGEGGFAGAGVADHRHRLAGGEWRSPRRGGSGDRARRRSPRDRNARWQRAAGQVAGVAGVGDLAVGACIRPNMRSMSVSAWRISR
jgi:hypothetical protein